MKTFIVTSALVAIAMIPSCPAPPAFIPGLIAGAVGSVGAGVADVAINASRKKRALMRVERRQSNLPAGVPQQAMDECTSSIPGINIQVTEKGFGSYEIDNIPASCMNLATYFTGAGSLPLPCGDACLTYENLSDFDIGALQGAVGMLNVAN